jgi:hypothetical protein
MYLAVLYFSVAHLCCFPSPPPPLPPPPLPPPPIYILKFIKFRQYKSKVHEVQGDPVDQYTDTLHVSACEYGTMPTHQNRSPCKG